MQQPLRSGASSKIVSVKLGILCALMCAYLMAQSTAQIEASAKAHLAARNVNAALADYQKLAAMNPQSAVYEDQIGFILASTNHLGDALPHLQHATELDPKMALAWYHLGVADCLIKNTQSCAESLQHAVALAPGNGDYHFRLGSALIRRRISTF